MTERLILFSGGIESTALLTLYRPGDHVMTVRHAHDATYDERAVSAIVEAMGVENHIRSAIDTGVPTNGQATFQFHWLLAVAGVYVEPRVKISQVWYGFHETPPGTGVNGPRIMGEYARVKAMWSTWHPQVSLVSPYVHLTKAGHWDLIPDHVKPLVRNCYHINDCGTCAKCQELKALPGSFWSAS